MTNDAQRWNRSATWALATLVVGSALSLIWLVHPWYEAGGETNDGSIYLACAKSLLAGDGYAYLGDPFTLRPPGFSVLLLPVLALRGVDFYALNLFASCFGVLAVACLFIYHQRRLGTLLAFAVAASLWLNPAFEHYCNRVMSDVPGTALLLLGLVLERWASRRESVARDVLVGVFVGLTSYVRSVDFVIAPAIVCARLCARWKSGERGGWLRFVLERCVVPLIVPILVLLPWSLRNAAHPPELPIDQTFVHSYSVALLHTDTADPSSPLVPASELLGRARDNFGVIASSIGDRMREATPSRASWLIGAIVGALALAAAVRRREVDDFVLLGSLAAFSISLEVRERYGLPLYVLALPSALDTLRWLAARWTGERVARGALTALVVIVTALDFAPRSYWDKVRSGHAEFTRNCAEIEQVIAPDAVLASSVGWHLSVYLDRPVYSLVPRLKHKGRLDAVEEVISRRGINTVVCLRSRNLDDSIIQLLRQNYGAPKSAGNALAWRVRL